jgi:hypothetical protein
MSGTRSAKDIARVDLARRILDVIGDTDSTVALPALVEAMTCILARMPEERLPWIERNSERMSRSLPDSVKRRMPGRVN